MAPVLERRPLRRAAIALALTALTVSAIAVPGVARTEVRYRTQVAGSMGVRQWIGREPTLGYGAGYGTGLRLPVTRTEFHNIDGLAWRGHFRQYRTVDGERLDDTELIGGDVAHEPGGRYAEEWNTAVFGPGLAGPDPWALRDGDRIDVRIPLFSDSAVDRVGFSETDSGRTALYRGDVLVGEHAAAGFGAFDVGPDETSYRLETEAVRSRVSRLSTRISTTWTFRSGRVDGWQRLPVTGGTITVPQPPGAKFVSLSASARDTAGNTVTQTVSRAYAL